MDLNQIKKQLNENYDLVFKSLEIDYEIVGNNLYAKCPAHANSDNPRGFSYTIDKGYWKCWTRECQNDYKNDIFGLIRGCLEQKQGSIVEFKDALRWSCTLLNIDKVKTKPKIIHQPYEDMVNIVNIFRQPPQTNNEKSINYTTDNISQYFLNRGFSKEVLLEFEVSDSINSYRMHDRAIIPIYDDVGENIVALIGRSIKEYKIPKFLIYPKGFDKRFYLYNYHRAIQKAKETLTLFIVEGQGDVWKLHEAGVNNVVGLFGKTISDEQERKILKLPVTNLIILTDNDQAGRESKTQIKRQFNRTHKLIFPTMRKKDIGSYSVDQLNQHILSELKGLY